MTSRQMLSWLVIGFMLCFLFMACDAIARADTGTGVTVGPTRQVLPRHKSVEVLVGNFDTAQPMRVTTSTAVGSVATGALQFTAQELPLQVTPSAFTLRNRETVQVRVKQTGHIAQPLAAVVFTFTPVHSATTGVLVQGQVMAQLTVHPEAALFAPPPPAAAHSSLPYLPLGLLLLALCGVADWVRRQWKKPGKPKEQKQKKPQKSGLSFKEA